MKKSISIILIMFLFSCGARKVEKQDDKVDVKIENKTEKEDVKFTDTQKDESVNTNTKETSSEDEKTIEPIDPYKEMVIDGKSYKNAKLTTKSKSSTKDTKEDKKVSETGNIKEVKKENKKENTEVTKSTKSKKVERKENFIFSIWFWIILVILCVALYYCYNKYKDKFWLFKIFS
mgnify:CR=1 FL=1